MAGGWDRWAGPSEASQIAQLIDLFIAHHPAVLGGKGTEADHRRGGFANGLALATGAFLGGRQPDVFDVERGSHRQATTRSILHQRIRLFFAGANARMAPGPRCK
jgi:hypothetical protein